MPRQIPLGTHRVRDHNGRYHIIKDAELLDAARRAALDHFSHQPLLDSAQAAVTYLEAAIARQEREVFAVLWLDARHRVLAYEELFFGSIDRAAVHPREVVKAGLKINAAAVILCHNHPSGVCEPSQADRALTTQLKEVLEVVDIRLLDHIIVASQSFSFAADGLL